MTVHIGNIPVETERQRPGGLGILVIEPDLSEARKIETSLRSHSGVSDVVVVSNVAEAEDAVTSQALALSILDPACLTDPLVDCEVLLDRPGHHCILYSSLPTDRLGLVNTRASVSAVIDRSDGLDAILGAISNLVQRIEANCVEHQSALKDHKVALSRRERQTLNFLGHGFTLKETANRLNINPKTVETYKSRALSKLGITSRAELVSFVAFGLTPES